MSSLQNLPASREDHVFSDIDGLFLFIIWYGVPLLFVPLNIDPTRSAAESYFLGMGVNAFLIPIFGLMILLVKR